MNLLDIVALLVIGAGYLTMLVASIIFLVIAFRTSFVWGLLCLFLPPSGLIFLLVHWNESRVAFLINLAGVGVCVLGVLISPTFWTVMSFAKDGGSSSDARAKVEAFLKSQSLPQTNDKDQLIEANMKVVEEAARSYASENSGWYPSTVDALKNRLPGGKPLLNPCNGKEEYPVPGGATDLRTSLVGVENKVMIPGSIEYSVLPDKRTYVIIGGSVNGRGLKVLSNGLGQ